MLCWLPRSDFKTSRHYLAGVPQALLPASPRPSQPGRGGVAAGFGTMNDHTPDIIIGGNAKGLGIAPVGLLADDDVGGLVIHGAKTSRHPSTSRL